MGDRLTSEWTDTAEEAFGSTGAKGRIGELFMIEVFKKWGWEVSDEEDNKYYQTRGVDLQFRRPCWKKSYSCDVKNNMNEYGSFYVHKDWLLNPRHINDRYFHVNPDTGWVAFYSAADMKTWYRRYHINEEYVRIDPTTGPAFIKRSKNVIESKPKIESIDCGREVKGFANAS